VNELQNFQETQITIEFQILKEPKTTIEPQTFKRIGNFQ
jgi:hypothetical protein